MFLSPVGPSTLEFATASLEWMADGVTRAFESGRGNPLRLKCARARAGRGARAAARRRLWRAPRAPPPPHAAALPAFPPAFLPTPTHLAPPRPPPPRPPCRNVRQFGGLDELRVSPLWRSPRPLAVLATGPDLDPGSLSREAGGGRGEGVAPGP